jgi:DNA/RNA endonuclease YhcR with UshA esterase domain
MSSNIAGEANCPSCGRFIGPVDRCAYCGASVKRRFSLKALKFGSLAVAIAGVFLLYLAARGIEPPVVRVRDLRPGMNRSFVRIDGRVDGNPRTLDSGTVMFTLDDGTGKITVFVDDDVAKELRAAKKLPANDDAVSVAGYLAHKKDRPWIINVNAPEHFSRRSGAVQARRVPIKDISRDLLGQLIEVEGTLGEVNRKIKGVVVFRIEQDGTGVDVKVFDKTFGALVSRLETRGSGTEVSVRGTVEEYKGRLQLAPRDTADIVIAPD